MASAYLWRYLVLTTVVFFTTEVFPCHSLCHPTCRRLDGQGGSFLRVSKMVVVLSFLTSKLISCLRRWSGSSQNGDSETLFHHVSIAPFITQLHVHRTRVKLPTTIQPQSVRNHAIADGEKKSSLKETSDLMTLSKGVSLGAGRRRIIRGEGEGKLGS